MIALGVRIDVVTAHAEALAVDAEVVFLGFFEISKAVVHELGVSSE